MVQDKACWFFSIDHFDVCFSQNVSIGFKRKITEDNAKFF